MPDEIPEDETQQSEADDRREWVEPTITSYGAQELTQSGARRTTDFGGPGNDCS